MENEHENPKGEITLTIFGLLFIIGYLTFVELIIPLNVSDAIKVLNEHDGKFAMGNAVLHMEKVSESDVEDEYFREGDTYRIFILTIDDEVVKKVIKKG